MAIVQVEVQHEAPVVDDGVWDSYAHNPEVEVLQIRQGLDGCPGGELPCKYGPPCWIRAGRGHRKCGDEEGWQVAERRARRTIAVEICDHSGVFGNLAEQIVWVILILTA